MQKWRGVVLQRRSLFVLGAIVVLIIIAIIPIAICKIPERQVERLQPTAFVQVEPSPTASPQTTQLRSPSQTEIAKLEDDYRKTVVQSVGIMAQIIGGIIVLFGLYFTWRTVRIGQENLELAQRNLEASRDSTQMTLELSREGQITERFAKAIEQLGDDKLEVRLGGIYALKRIAKDSEKDHWTIMEVLTAYIREHAPWQEDEAPKENQPEPKPPVDIQAILTVLGRRERAYGKGESERLDLHRVNIKRAHLEGAHLEGAYLEEAHLEKAILREAHLEEASLMGAHLEGAILTGAHLKGATLWGAHLKRAVLAQANLEGAILKEAYLGGAILTGAHLKRAVLAQANLEGAILKEAYLGGAILTGAHLEGADLTGAHLEGADLTGAHLEGADLMGIDLDSIIMGTGLDSIKFRSASGVTQEQIDKAFGDETTTLPAGLQIPEHWKSKTK